MAITPEQELAHLQDEYEKLRTKCVRVVAAQVDLLRAGLSAIRRDPPKVHVMDDHAQRSIDALCDLMKELVYQD